MYGGFKRRISLGVGLFDRGYHRTGALFFPKHIVYDLFNFSSSFFYHMILVCLFFLFGQGGGGELVSMIFYVLFNKIFYSGPFFILKSISFSSSIY